MRNKSALLITVLLAMVLTLTGCGQIPKSGPVGQSDSGQAGRKVSAYNFNPDPPADGASAEETVRGFLNAGTGPSEDYRVAREYLAPDLATEWNPVAQTYTYRGEPKITPGSDDGEFVVQFELDSIIDANGIMTEMPDDSTRALTFKVAEIEGQQRIVEAPDGTVVQANQFPVLFSSQKLYFFDSTYKYLVPDVRWFVNRTGIAAAVVGALLNGPAPYLSSAVSSAFPEGTELSRSAIPVEAGTATVDFDPIVFENSSAQTRQRMHQQLEASLNQLTTIQDVVLTADQREVGLGRNETSVQLAEQDPTVGSTQIAINNKSLVYFEGREPVPIGGMPNVRHTNPRYPAMDVRGTVYAFLNEGRTQLYTVNESKGLSAALTGSELSWPSIDNSGWVWTVDNAGRTPKINAVPIQEIDGVTRSVSANWLDGKKVAALKISADGARAAVVAGDADGNKLYIAGVIRDSEGVPRGLTNPTMLRTEENINFVNWASETKVIAAEVSPVERVTPEIIGLDGKTETLRPLLGLTNVSIGQGEDSIYAETEETVYLRVGSSWRAQETAVSDLNYPG